MSFSTRSNQRGFSLVELMVVVAIIGILASIAIPSVNKYMAKARQSEAKTNLSSLYTSEKAFYAEYNTYDTRFSAVGYTPEGQLRYNIGFTGGVIANASNGYNTPPQNQDITANTYCGVNGAFENGCSVLNGASGVAAPDIAAGMCTAGGGSAHAALCTTTVSTFRIGAGAVIQATATNPDYWSIDDAKVVRNTSNGLQ